MSFCNFSASSCLSGGILTIDLQALRDNYTLIARNIAPVRTAAVVKANAYGLGVHRIAPVFYQVNCRDFFVAHLSEALELRSVLPQDAAIYILNGLQPNAEKICAEAGIIPVLNSPKQMENWVRISQASGHSLPAILHVDTGMSRLGFSMDEVEYLATHLELLKVIDIKFIMTHLACADELDHIQNAAQLERLRIILRTLPPFPVTFANSSGTFLDRNFHFDLARPGVALYGAASISGKSNPMHPVVQLHACVIQVRDIPADTPVGYGGSFISTMPMRIAAIAVGYADGWLRHLSNKGAAYFGKTRLPIIGRVSMDNITLDVTALAKDTLTLGSFVELIGPHQTLEDVASDCGTIPYEILTSLGQRYSRHYINP